MKKSSLTLNGLTNAHLLLFVAAIGMSISSLYLLVHHFQVFYPKGLGLGTVCDINGFFSCDAVAYSIVSQIFGIPIALFGLLAGTFLLYSSIFPSEKLESSNHILVYLNFIGCVLLFLYSLIALKHLCPFCSLYYLFSGLAAILFYRFSSFKKLETKIITIYAIITFIAIGIFSLVVYSKESDKKEIANVILEDFKTYPNLGNPEVESPYRLASATKNFSDAPIRISIFSDFECSACAMMSEIAHKVAIRYQGKINIQYFFYPLDNECNPFMQGPMHINACKAAYLTACKPEEFKELHDVIFKNQANINASWINDLAKKEGVYDCMNNPETKKTVVSLIEASKDFNIKATPTMILNGVKIEGARSLETLYIIIDDLVKNSR